MAEKNYVSRLWFYFRNGYGTYFAFILAAINTLTVTYYLAIEKFPTLQTIFPSFGQYVLIIAAIGIPLLISIGFVHFKAIVVLLISVSRHDHERVSRF